MNSLSIRFFNRGSIRKGVVFVNSINFYKSAEKMLRFTVLKFSVGKL